jgi:hypothetical protein
MNEKLLEKKLFKEVKSMGGIGLKITSPNHAGKFDRLLIMPHEIIWFVEVKTTGKKLDPLQEIFKKELDKRSQRNAVIDDLKSLNNLLTILKSEI